MSAQIPSFVGDDYFCDTGSQDPFQRGMFYSADPLWDGALWASEHMLQLQQPSMVLQATSTARNV